MTNETQPGGLIERILDVIERDIAPLTEAGVARGNKLFGAAIIRKSDLSLVIAETNNEIENPLWHGEVHALKRFYELPRAARPAAEAGREDPAIVAGESGGAGLAGLIRAAADPEIRATLGLNEASRVLVFNTEGATDPQRYAELVGMRPEAVMTDAARPR